MFVLTISRPSSNMGYVGSKTRSPGQILGNSCLHSRGQICDLILIKLSQNVCLDNIQAKFEYGSFRIKNQVTSSNLRKFLCILQWPHFDPILMKFDQNVCLDNNQAKFGYGFRRVKSQVTRSNLRKLLFLLQRPHLRPDWCRLLYIKQ